MSVRKSKAEMNPVIQFLRGHSNLHFPGDKPNVFIFSMPRSGSTWLQELLWTQPGFKYVNEPLNLKGRWMQKESGIHGFEELYTLEVKEKVLRYFEGFTSGKLHFLDPSPLRRNYRPITRRIVFKVIHGGELFINDIADRCNGRIIYLLRHPIAVGLSRKQLPRMDQLCSDLVLNQFTSEEKEYALKIQRSGTPMELRILAWCLQNKLALLHRKNTWMVFTYEQLVADPRVIVDKMIIHADLPRRDLIDRQLTVPSAVSVQSRPDAVELMSKHAHERVKLTDAWKKRLDPKEAVRLMEICTKMNFEVYDVETGAPQKDWLV